MGVCEICGLQEEYGHLDWCDIVEERTAPLKAALAAEHERLQTILDAERGVRGLEGWRRCGNEWSKRFDDWGWTYIERGCDDRYTINAESMPECPDSWDYCLEAMEAAEAARKEQE